MSTKTITRDELAKALEHVQIHVGHDVYGGCKTVDIAAYPDALANDLFRHVENDREPEYECGAVYVDAYGENWTYSFVSKSWYAFGSDHAHAFTLPKRPLRKLVPEV